MLLYIVTKITHRRATLHHQTERPPSSKFNNKKFPTNKTPWQRRPTRDPSSSRPNDPSTTLPRRRSPLRFPPRSPQARSLSFREYPTRCCSRASSCSKDCSKLDCSKDCSSRTSTSNCSRQRSKRRPNRRRPGFPRCTTSDRSQVGGITFLTVFFECF